jgi:hypothetical protein
MTPLKVAMNTRWTHVKINRGEYIEPQVLTPEELKESED